jgi:hypothetical protein
MNLICQNMLYRLDTLDGIEHIMRIQGVDPEMYEIESIHRFKDHEVKTRRHYNKCLFEELLSLGIISPILD